MLRVFGWVQIAMLVVLAFGVFILPFVSPLPEQLSWVDGAWYPVAAFGACQALIFLAVGSALKRHVRWAKPAATALAVYALMLVPMGTFFGALALNALFFAAPHDA